MRHQAADQAAGDDGAATDPEPEDSDDARGSGGGGGDGGDGAAAAANLLGETQMLPEEELAQWQRKHPLLG
jgi:hypothetical protein